MSWKEWDQGEVVEAGDLQEYIQDQVVQNYADSAARSTALGTAVAEGMVSYLQDSNSVEVYDGSAWVAVGNDLSSGTAGYTALSNGTAGLSYQPVSHNYIINGAFDIWQRGTSFTSVGGVSEFNADRWLINPTTGATSVITREDFTPGDIEAIGFGDAKYFLRVDNDGSGGGNDSRFQQRIEDVRTLAGQTATLSFYIKTNNSEDLGLEVRQNFGSGGSSDSGVASETVTTTTSWQRVSYTFTVPSMSGKTIGTGSYLYLRLRVIGAVATVFDIWGVQLEAGSIATPFKRNANSIAGELAACQRYYQIYGTQANEFLTTGFCYSTSQSLSTFNFVQEMRVAPTISFSAASDFGLYAVGASSKTVNAIAAGFASTKSFRLQANIGTTDLGAGNATNVFSGSGGGRIEVDAEL